MMAAASTMAMDHAGPGPTLAGTKIGGYTLTRRIGAGGMGEVYEALHATPGKRAVVKVLADLRGDDASLVERRQRFMNEAKALCTLHHPSLVELYDWGELPDGNVYILMEFVDGVSLREHLEQRGPLPQAEAVEIARQLAEALAVVHAAGVVHRDLTPNNVLVFSDCSTRLGIRVKLLDFGIAKLRSGHEVRTQTGDCFGTPRYMAPEQCESTSSVDDRADVYALGLLLFELLTGRSPYTVAVSTPVRWMDAQLRQRPLSLLRLQPKASKSLDQLLAAMLDKTADQRPSAAQIAQVLGQGLRFRRSLHLSKFALRSSVGTLAILVSIGAGYQALSRWRHDSQPLDVDNGKPATHTLPTRSPSELGALAARAPTGMVLIPGGWFVMGSSRSQVQQAFADCQRIKPTGGCFLDLYERELSEHRVGLQPYYLSQYEVTNAQYAEFLNRLVPHPVVEIDSKGQPRRVTLSTGTASPTVLVDLFTKDGRGSHIRYDQGTFVVAPDAAQRPVVQVSYLGAREFCQRRGWDLPSEAQWEFAAQSVPALSTPSNSGLGCDTAALAMDAARCPHAQQNGPTPIGTHPHDRNTFGVHDLIGNVSEWVRDAFVAPYPACEACIDPVELGSPEPAGSDALKRIFRGGSFNLSPVAARAQSRSTRPQTSVSPDIGFRCAVSAVKAP